MAQRSPTIPVSNEKTEPQVPLHAERLTPPQNNLRVVSRDKYDGAVSATRNLLQDADRKLSHAANLTGRRLRWFADERPLQLLAVVAGVAFAAGVALRIWRSMRYE